MGTAATGRGLDAISDGVVLCACLTQARTPDLVLAAADVGFDAVYVDLEHSSTPLDATATLCATALAVGITPFVRVASHSRATIGRVLDGGALGLIVPHVDTADQAASLASMVHLPPIGARSLYGYTPLASVAGISGDELAAEVARRTVFAPMIESTTAVDQVDKIAAVEGVDLLLVGVHDLTASLGIPGRFYSEALSEALQAVAGAASAHGKAFGIAGLTDPQLLGPLVEAGLRFISAGTDVGFFRQAAAARVSELRAVGPAGQDPA
jgi:2-keto-3-deoxy-L-rhamnonate aldolase RhmA